MSGKKRADCIFPGRGANSSRPMTVRQMSRLLKSWIAEAGLDPKKYGIESLRRTKALHILSGTGDIETVRALLGHAKIDQRATYAPPKGPTRSQFHERSISELRSSSIYRPQHLNKQTLQRRDCGACSCQEQTPPASTGP